jgi:predicted RNA-binding protein with RPS1 domain
MTDLSPGQLVWGVVREHQPFGVFIDIGEDEPGVAVITMLEDEPRSRTPEFPPVGSKVDAVFLGFSGPGRQPRLSLRPADVAKARDAE